MTIQLLPPLTVFGHGVDTKRVVVHLAIPVEAPVFTALLVRKQQRIQSLRVRPPDLRIGHRPRDLAPIRIDRVNESAVFVIPAQFAMTADQPGRFADSRGVATGAGDMDLKPHALDHVAGNNRRALRRGVLAVVTGNTLKNDIALGTVEMIEDVALHRQRRIAIPLFVQQFAQLPQHQRKDHGQPVYARPGRHGIGKVRDLVVRLLEPPQHAVGCAPRQVGRRILTRGDRQLRQPINRERIDIDRVTAVQHLAVAADAQHPAADTIVPAMALREVADLPGNVKPLRALPNTVVQRAEHPHRPPLAPQPLVATDQRAVIA